MVQECFDHVVEFRTYWQLSSNHKAELMDVVGTVMTKETKADLEMDKITPYQFDAGRHPGMKNYIAYSLENMREQETFGNMAEIEEKILVAGKEILQRLIEEKGGEYENIETLPLIRLDFFYDGHELKFNELETGDASFLTPFDGRSPDLIRKVAASIAAAIKAGRSRNVTPPDA